MKHIRTVQVLLVLAAAFTFGLGGSADAFLITVSSGTRDAEGVSNEVFTWVTDEAVVQIIRAVGGVKYPPANDPPDYVGGTDVFLISGEVGDGFPFGPKLGRFTVDVGVETGWYIYARVYNNTAISTATYYGDSGLFYVSAGVTEGYRWNIGGEVNSPAFRTSNAFEFVPPGPPHSFEATAMPTGDITLTWTNTSDADLARVVIRYRTNGVFPTRETEGSAFYDQPATPSSSASALHSGLNVGTTYYYSIFSKDLAGNFSTSYATAFATSIDLISPEVQDYLPKGTSVPIGTNLWIDFSEGMNRTSVENALHIWPPVTIEGYSWSGDSRTLQVLLSDMAYGTTYVVSIETTATDVAGNFLDPTPEAYPLPFIFTFTTELPPPDVVLPVISDLMIQGNVVYDGDVITSRPRITAVISDEGLPSKIASVEVLIDGQSRYYGSPGTGFDAATGTFEYAVPAGESLNKGKHTVIIRAWDLPPSLNITAEGRTDLRVFGSDVEVIGPVLNYPNPFSPWKKKESTFIAYTLASDFDVTVQIFDLSAHLIWSKKIDSGSDGGRAGYNEVRWDGKKFNGGYAGNGIYVLQVTGGGKVLATSKLAVID